jgi:hypothetical protein
MSKDDNKITIWLAYYQEKFPYGQWFEHLKRFKINRQKTKSTEECQIWKPVEGKGYIIWISYPHLAYSEDKHYWKIGLSMNKTVPEEGKSVMNQIVDSSLEKFPNLKKVE